MWNVEETSSLHYGTAYLVARRGMVLGSSDGRGSGGALHFRVKSDAEEIAALLNMAECK
ncbi:MAG TPA: hypothetical protein VN039_11685 [Nitrospira sp.]|jgi:hypothetical protein|nr:hypothetical protein [Nitrospira sp.]